ncbi:MAG: V-type ATP synthase subunit F [Chloroflexota bacterium]
MMQLKHMAIAVIGDEDLVSAMRLAGVSRYQLISGENIADEVRQALSGLIAEPDIGVIALAEDYVPYVEDLLARVKEGRRSTPVIIEVPSKYGAGGQDVKAYYKAYIRKYIGFDIEI